MEQFSDYSHAIASIALWSLLVIVLAGLSTKGRTSEGRCDCGKPKRNYADPVYRRERAFMNAVEGGGPFIGATLAAMLAGASPFAVNLLASLYLVFRIAMAIVHVRTENQKLRSASFAAGLLCTVGLAVMAVIAAF
ncbi:MAG: MAPEG family protein [Sulfitobacter sp.]